VVASNEAVRRTVGGTEYSHCRHGSVTWRVKCTPYSPQAPLAP
jgi:hypothetical protein